MPCLKNRSYGRNGRWCRRWHHSSDPADRRRLDELSKAAGYDWRIVHSFRSKEEAGHEEPWFTYLIGHNPDYPEMILAAAQAQVRHRTQT